MTHHILLWTDTPDAYLDAAAPFAGRVTIDVLPVKQKPSPEQCAATTIMLAWRARAGLLPTMPALQWVQTFTAGVESWLALPDLPTDLMLTCARGTHRNSMPENILGALFHITKPYAAMAEAQSRHQWDRRLAVPLSGKTLGILGLGTIGQDLARMASAIGLRVIGTKRSHDDIPGVEVFPPERTDEVLAQSDFVVLLLPATSQTENFIDAARLSQMKPDAWLLNFGRGQLIKDNDLIEAVQQKRIAGAILDVFRREPLPSDHPFWATEGILVLPHIGGGHPDRNSAVAQLFAENLSRFLDGKPLKEVVDRAAGY